MNIKCLVDQVIAAGVVPVDLTQYHGGEEGHPRRPTLVDLVAIQRIMLSESLVTPGGDILQ